MDENCPLAAGAAGSSSEILPAEPGRLNVLTEENFLGFSLITFSILVLSWWICDCTITIFTNICSMDVSPSLR